MRFLIAGILLLASTSAFASKPAKQSASKKGKTWDMLIQHVLTKGIEWPIKAPMSKALGYDAEQIPTKTLGIDQDKSKDNREHNVYVVYANDIKGKPQAKEVVLANIRVIEKDGKQTIDAYRARAKLDGSLIRGVHSTGIAGEAIQTALDGESTELKSVFKSEKEMYLKAADWSLLTAE